MLNAVTANRRHLTMAASYRAAREKAHAGQQMVSAMPANWLRFFEAPGILLGLSFCA
jgi:hypothetical protein